MWLQCFEMIVCYQAHARLVLFLPTLVVRAAQKRVAAITNPGCLSAIMSIFARRETFPCLDLRRALRVHMHARQGCRGARTQRRSQLINPAHAPRRSRRGILLRILQLSRVRTRRDSPQQNQVISQVLSPPVNHPDDQALNQRCDLPPSLQRSLHGVHRASLLRSQARSLVDNLQRGPLVALLEVLQFSLHHTHQVIRADSLQVIHLLSLLNSPLHSLLPTPHRSQARSQLDSQLINPRRDLQFNLQESRAEFLLVSLLIIHRRSQRFSRRVDQALYRATSLLAFRHHNQAASLLDNQHLNQVSSPLFNLPHSRHGHRLGSPRDSLSHTLQVSQVASQQLLQCIDERLLRLDQLRSQRVDLLASLVLNRPPRLRLCQQLNGETSMKKL